MHSINVTNPRVFCLTASIVLFVVCNVTLIVLNVVPLSPKIELVISRKCYEFPNHLTNTDLLDDILTAKIKPSDRRSIFFLVTTCSSDDATALNAR